VRRALPGAPPKEDPPWVFFDRVCDDVQASRSVIDDERSAFDAVTYLLRKGYTKIAHFAGSEDLRICSKRMQGMSMPCCPATGFPMAEDFVRHGGLDERNGYRSMDALIRDGAMPEAIFAVNDPWPSVRTSASKKRGLRIPETSRFSDPTESPVRGMRRPASLMRWYAPHGHGDVSSRRSPPASPRRGSVRPWSRYSILFANPHWAYEILCHRNPVLQQGIDKP